MLVVVRDGMFPISCLVKDQVSGRSNAWSHMRIANERSEVLCEVFKVKF
jgi:hypothetical protein